MRKKNLSSRSKFGVKYYGIHACLTLAKKRPHDILRLYIDPSNLFQFKAMLKWCSQHKKPYHVVEIDELNRVADSVHHEGICIVANEPSLLNGSEFLSLLESLPQQICCLYLDGIENPHNFGSILRTAAHFGVSHILSQNIPFSPSACRIAKGGAEIVGLVRLEKPCEMLRLLQKKGFACIATSSHQGKALSHFSFSPRALFILGSESKGLSAQVAKASTHQVRILGTGVMESLNVAVATGICLNAYYSQYPLKQ